jgi:hypothetical protein
MERGGLYLGTVAAIVLIGLAFIGLLAVCNDNDSGPERPVVTTDGR